MILQQVTSGCEDGEEHDPQTVNPDRIPAAKHREPQGNKEQRVRRDKVPGVPLQTLPHGHFRSGVLRNRRTIVIRVHLEGKTVIGRLYRSGNQKAQKTR